MVIRPFEPDDEASVIDLWQKCSLTRPWNNPRLDIERKLKDSPQFLFVGTLDGRIVSSVMAGYDGHRGWVYYLAVGPDYRKLGLGKQIMAHAEAKLLEIGCPKIDLMVRKSNAGVIEFYKKIGYGEDEVITLSRGLVEDGPG